jgi:hypothetical protein
MNFTQKRRNTQLALFSVSNLMVEDLTRKNSYYFFQPQLLAKNKTNYISPLVIRKFNF